MKWTVFASGGPVDNPWDEEKVVEANDVNEAMQRAGFDFRNVDGVIRNDVLDELST